MGANRWMLAVMAGAVLFAGCGNDGPKGVSQDTDRPPTVEWPYVARTSPDSVALYWTDVATGEAGYQIERSLRDDGGFEVIANTAPEVNHYTDTTAVVPGTLYYYRIYTRDTLARLSDPSATLWARAVTDASPAAPGEPNPADKGFDLDLPGLVTLTWTVSDPDGPAPRSAFYFGEGRNALELLGADLTTPQYTLSDTLALTRFYFWRVVTWDADGATALSPIWSFGTHMERVSVPEGYFFQGDSARFYPAARNRFASPANPVLTASFNMDKYEASNQLCAQAFNELLEGRYIRVAEGRVYSVVGDVLYAEVFPVGDEHSGIEFIANGSTTGGVFIPRAGRENHPAVEISWHGAKRIAEYFGRRLPTESEWEKTARGTSTELGDTTFTVGGEALTLGLGSPYPWGREIDGHYCNYAASGDPYEGRVGVSTTPIGFYDGQQHSGFSTVSNRSPYGVFDMAGNVAEWCQDDFIPYHEGSFGGLKCLKGGGWRSQPEWCQTFWREGVHPDSTDNMIGFRTAATE